MKLIWLGQKIHFILRNSASFAWNLIYPKKQFEGSTLRSLMQDYGQNNIRQARRDVFFLCTIASFMIIKYINHWYILNILLSNHTNYRPLNIKTKNVTLLTLTFCFRNQKCHTLLSTHGQFLLFPFQFSFVFVTFLFCCM